MTEQHLTAPDAFSHHYQEAILSLKRRMLAEEAALEAMGLDRSTLGLYCTPVPPPGAEQEAGEHGGGPGGGGGGAGGHAPGSSGGGIGAALPPPITTHLPPPPPTPPSSTTNGITSTSSSSSAAACSSSNAAGAGPGCPQQAVTPPGPQHHHPHHFLQPGYHHHQHHHQEAYHDHHHLHHQRTQDPYLQVYGQPPPGARDRAPTPHSPDHLHNNTMPMQEFVNKSNLHQHSKEVHRMQEKMHKCVKCFKSFPSSQQLNQHMLVHNNIRKYRCQYCDKAFKQLSHVQQHQRRHTGERPYKCTIEGCDKSFAQLSNLQQHQRNHDARRQQSDRKPYQCSICDRRFATEVSLNNHISKLHADMYRIPERRCQVCGKQFYTEEKHVRHMNRFHPDLWAEFSGGRPLEFFIPPRDVQHREKKFVCTVCSKTYSHETGLLKHLVTHPESQELRTRLWSCCVCDKVFTKESYLERHLEMKLDPEHGKALSEYKKRNGIKEVGRVHVNMLLPPATSSALVSSSDGVVGGRGAGSGGGGGSGEVASTSTQDESEMQSPPPSSSSLGPPLPPPHAADLSIHPHTNIGPRSPMLGSPTPSCSLAAADSTVPSPFSPPPPPASSQSTSNGVAAPVSTTSSSFSSSLLQRSPTLTRPLSHPSPLLNRSFSESCLSSPHPLFGPAMSGAISHAAASAAMDAVSHALHGPMSPPPQHAHAPPPPQFRSQYGGYGAPGMTSQHHWGTSPSPAANLHHVPPNLHNANLHSTNLPPLRFSHLPFRRDYGPPRPGEQEDVVSALQSLADSIHPS